MKTALIFALLLSTVAALHAQQPTLAEVFDQPHVTAQELAKKAVGREQRYVVKCVVMFQRLDGIFMGHAEGTNFILTPRRNPSWPAGLNRVRLRPGDEVEVSGFLINARELLQMNDVVFRVTARDRPLPAPLELSESQLPTFPHKCDLVRLTIPLRYVAQTNGPNHFIMRLFLGDRHRVTAMVGSSAKLSRDHLLDGYMVEVTGFLTRQNGNESYLWMRSPEDIRVFGPGPTVQMQRRWQWGTVAFIGIGGIGLWILALRRQVRVQTRTLRAVNERLQSSEKELIANLTREKEVNELKSNFVSLVSHEFRTPLAVILSSTELLRNHMARLGEETRRTQMDNIIQSTHIMSGMIEEVLLLGKVEGGHMTCTPVPLDLATFAAVVVDEGLSATQKRCPIHLYIAPLPGPAVADPALLRHIFSNLLGNAVKYSPDGSPVEFSISHEKGQGLLVIRDQGIGIPEKDRGRLFEAFHRASNVGQRSGTGLGLVIVKRCVELHGGSISVESEEQKGTTVTVRLPLFPQA
ncbi:MAG: HAMP domain-containing sensor histidine kinase [Verrucomicrobiota bacterium]